MLCPFTGVRKREKGELARLESTWETEAMTQLPSILIVDDDPLHLHLYGLILEKAGYRGVPVLVSRGAVQLPDVSIQATLLDYRLGPSLTSVEAAEAIRKKYPGTPILLLSDMHGLPMDIAPYVEDFVRKGEPEKLVTVLRRLGPAEGIPL
jgi:CheY-like chemotaxis protein